MKKRIISIVLCVAMLLTANVQASAATASDGSAPPITMSDINSSESKVIYISEESKYSPYHSDIMPLSYGSYPIYTRVTTTQRSSNGIIERSSQIGNYTGISSLALSFVSGIPAMTVSTILALVSLAVSQDTYVQAKTYTSYVDYQKQGEARWSDEDASYFTPWVYSGKRDHYKHILGATRNSSGIWTTKTKDYLDSPAKTETGTFYNQSNTWFQEEARQRAVSLTPLFDLPW